MNAAPSTLAPPSVRERLEERLRAELARYASVLPPESPFDGAWSLAGGPDEGISTAPRTVGEALLLLGERTPTMAQREADRIGLAMRLVHPPALHSAVLERLVPTWPWWAVSGEDDGFVMLLGLARLTGVFEFIAATEVAGEAFPEDAEETSNAPVWQHMKEAVNVFVARSPFHETAPWPSDVAKLDVLLWARDGLNRTAKGRGDRYEKRARELAEWLSRPLEPQPIDFGDDDSDGPRHYFDANGDRMLWRGLGLGDQMNPPAEAGPPGKQHSPLFVMGHQLAWTYSAVAGVERDRRVPAFRMPAGKHAHAATMMFVRPPKAGERADLWTATDMVKASSVQDAALELTWAGKTTPYQLALLADSEGDIGEEIARGLVAELGPEALRDWLALHRIASDQGGDGSFRWTWEEHRERTHYADAVRNGKAIDADLARESRRRIWRFKQAELWTVGRTPDGKVMRVRVGKHGLVDVSREILEADGATPVAVGGCFNPALYNPRGKGARAGFTLLPEAALRLPSASLRIAVSAAFAMRRSEGATRMKARTLWEYAGLAERQRQTRARWPQCRNATERALGELEAIGMRWTGGGDGPDAVYELTAPAWWTDRLLHGVGPVLAAPATVAVPRTGPELAAMRKARGLSQRAIADVVGVSQPTVMRAEKAPAALPAEWLPKLAAARLTMP